MKVFRFLQVFIVLLLSCNALAGYSDDYSSSILREQQWTLGHDDPVELAREVIRSSSSFWNPLGYGVMRLKYTISRFAAQNGAGYLLLQSPRLTLDLIQEGLYGVVSSVSKDILLDIIEKSVGSPQELCEDVSNSVINEGLEDYAIAYKIARKFINDGSISREEAIEFLDKRWGVYKLVYAQGLYNASSSENYSLGSQARDILIEDITGELMNDYQRALGSGIPLPLAEYAFFVNDLVDILDNRNVGLMEFPPYLDFVSNMEGLNALRLDEMERFSSNVIVLPDGMEFVTIPSGSFMMGSPESEDGRLGNEGPRHSVSISSFEMMSTEVTQGMWEEIMGEVLEGSGYRGAVHVGIGLEYPVFDLSWFACQEFIERINLLDSTYIYRLPSESEWEYACRAGTDTRFFWGNSDSRDIGGNYANYPNPSIQNIPHGARGIFITNPVGSRSPNSFGLFDMSGNVNEWCQDVYKDNYDGTPCDGSAYSGSGSTRVTRSSNWFTNADAARSAYRSAASPSTGGAGFRVARSLR